MRRYSEKVWVKVENFLRFKLPLGSGTPRFINTGSFLLYSQGVTAYRKIYNFSFFVGTSYAQNHKYSSGVSTKAEGRRSKTYHFVILFVQIKKTAKIRTTFINTSYLTDSDTIFTLKMESVSKNTNFGLKMMVKSGL